MSRLRVGLSRLLYAVAAFLLGYWGYVWIESHGFQDHWSHQLERIEQAPPAGAQDAAAEAQRQQAREEAKADGVLGKLEVPRIALSVVIVEGTSDERLRVGVGHIEGTSLPGQPGNVGIAGHRDTYFRKLRLINRGDVIRLETTDNVYTYVVDSTMIVDPNRGDLLDPTPAPTLTIVTCYPFYYVGHAPHRFVVRAHQGQVKSATADEPDSSAGTLTAAPPR